MFSSIALALTLGGASSGPGFPPGTPPARASTTNAPNYCSTDYADDFAALTEKARDFDQAQPPYTYCIRSTAVYECPSYAADGSLRRARKKVVAHGTGFGYRQQGGETLLVTNEHVADWPAVTDAEHPVDDVPPGCKRVSDSLKIVDDESDAYEPDDVPLSRVVVDPQLDIAVLRAKVTLPVMPWRLGHSAALHERNVVDIRGFPLGVLRANNVGKVVSAYDHDDQHDWDHDDFVVDALLSPGNSGSPVFAISCRTGEFELVGVYHAGYEGGSALNVVVGVDQFRDLLSTLRRSPRAHPEGAPLEHADRERLSERARLPDGSMFPFGNLVAAVHPRPDGALVFELEGRDFPLRTNPALVLEDLPTQGTFGAEGRIWAGNRQGLCEVDRSELDAESLAQLAKLLDTLRREALLSSDYRLAARGAMSSREAFHEFSRLERAAKRSATERQDQGQAAEELAERLCPDIAETRATLADALAVPASGEEPPQPRTSSRDEPIQDREVSRVSLLPTAPPVTP
jgi:S1-C subfamily serine protease